MRKKFSVFIIGLVFASLIYAYIGDISNFVGHDDPFNISFTSNVNHSELIDFPLYGFVTNFTIIFQSTALANYSPVVYFTLDNDTYTGQNVEGYNTHFNATLTQSPIVQGGLINDSLNTSDSAAPANFLNLTNPQDLLYTNNFTFGFWVNFSHIDRQRIVANTFDAEAGDLSGWMVEIYPDQNNKISFFKNTGAATEQHLNVDHSVNDGDWHFITFVVGNTEGIRTYVDGVLNDSDASKNDDIYYVPSKSAYFQIGAADNNGTDEFFYSGLIDEFFILNYTIEDGDVSAIYNSYINDKIRIYDGVSSTIDLDVDGDTITDITATTNINASINPSIFNDVLVDNCNCSNCEIVGSSCRFNFTMLTSVSETFLLDIIESGYEWYLGQCNATLNASAFEFLTRDQKTGAEISTGVGFFYQYYPTLAPSTVDILTFNTSGDDNYSFCKFPEYVNFTGDMAHTISRSGYENQFFYRYDEPFNGVFRAYLLPTESTSAYITYTLLDSSNRRVTGALMSFFRYIGDELTLVHQEESDFAGQVNLYQDQQYLYHIEINASGFPFKEIDLKPVSTSYDIILTEEGETHYKNPYAGTRYRITPQTTQFNVTNDYYNITFELQSSGLVYWGINLTGHNYTCIPASCEATSTNSTGGILQVGINISEAGIFYTSLFMQRTGEDIIYLNSYPNHGSYFLDAAIPLIELAKDLKNELSPNQLTIVSAVLMTIFMSIGAFLGVLGSGLIIIGILGTILLMILQYVNVFVGLIIVVFGMAMVFINVREF